MADMNTDEGRANIARLLNEAAAGVLAYETAGVLLVVIAADGRAGDHIAITGPDIEQQLGWQLGEVCQRMGWP